MHPFIPDTAPFTPEQRAWLNGFFAGVFSRGEAAAVSNLKSEISNAAALAPLTILFGSQTGTAESLAKKLAKQAGKRGFAANVLDMSQVNLEGLASHSNLLVITSTYGDGEPPDNAHELHVALKSQISNLKSQLANPLASSHRAFAPTDTASPPRCSRCTPGS